MIKRVGSASNEAATVTIPAGHQVGDLLIIFAFRDGSTTNPSLPAGWTNITKTLDGTLCSVTMGWKLAISAADTSGTWTNATSTICHVYRGINDTSPVGTVTGTAGTTSPFTFGAVTLKNDTSSWIAAFIGHRSTDTTTLTTAPSGMTNLTSTLGATCDVASHDTNGAYRATTNYAANTVAPGGTDSGVVTAVIEIKAATQEFGNYQFLKASGVNAGVISMGGLG